MQHVGQSFDMHQPMLNRDVEQCAQREAAARLRIRSSDCLLQMLVQSAADTAYVVADGVLRGPVGGEIRGQSATDRIDAEGKQAIKSGTNTWLPEHPFVQ